MTFDASNLANPGVNTLVPFKQSKPIEELQREFGLHDVIKLASNENPLGPSPKALNAVQAVLSGINHYPDASGYNLKHKLAQHLFVSADQITLGNGSNEILALIAHTFLQPKHEVIYSAHSFVMYEVVTQMMHAKKVEVPTKDWCIDLNGILNAITDKTKVIFIANPNNPTGTYLTKEAIKAFLANVPDHILVVMDEAYHEFAKHLNDYDTSLHYLAEHPNLIITRTFSKSHGLAGLRIGFSITHETTANLLTRMCPTYNVNHLAQIAAIAALDDGEHVEKTVKTNIAGLKQLGAGFKKLDLDYLPSVGNFIALSVERDAKEIYQALLEQGIITRPMDIFGMPTYLRVSVGLAEENQRLLDALVHAV